MGFNYLKATEPLQRYSLLFYYSVTQNFLLLNWSTTEEWKTKETLQPPTRFEPKTLDLGI